MLRVFFLAFVVLIRAFADQNGANLTHNEGLLSSKGILAWKALLHYKGEASVIGAKSPFFISPKGYSDPIAELNLTIEAFKSDPDTQCKYPARLDFLLNNKMVDKSDLPAANCDDYQEYLRKVPFDRVYLVFAAEDHNAAESQMGHTILKIAGEDQNGVTREHSFSFMALLGESGNFTRYIRAIGSGTEGSYVLAPYSTIVETYTQKENRSLWEFELVLSEEAKDRLRKHLWELKETPINYQFVTHNCNTAIEAILTAADQSFIDNERLLFATPIEYLQLLEKRGLIKSVSVLPSAIDKAYFAQNKAFYPLEAPSASRVSIEGFDGGVRIGVMPNYRDIRSVSNASLVEFENKLIEVIARYENDEIKAENINLIVMKTISNFSVGGSSKIFRLGFEENAQNRLSPFFEWGRGIGLSLFDGAVIYVMPSAGFAYGKKANAFATIETGTIIRVGERAKFLADYTYFWDLDEDYRRFNGGLNARIIYAPSREYDIGLSYSKWFDTRDNADYIRDYDRDRIALSVSLYF